MKSDLTQPSFLALTGDGNLLPPLSDSEYQALKADIRRTGEVIVPVEVDGDTGEVLDGHHRVRAWQELKAEGVWVKDYSRLVRKFPSADERIAHAININRPGLHTRIN